MEVKDNTEVSTVWLVASLILCGTVPSSTIANNMLVQLAWRLRGFDCDSVMAPVIPKLSVFVKSIVHRVYGIQTVRSKNTCHSWWTSRTCFVLNACSVRKSFHVFTVSALPTWTVSGDFVWAVRLRHIFFDGRQECGTYASAHELVTVFSHALTSARKEYNRCDCRVHVEHWDIARW